MTTDEFMRKQTFMDVIRNFAPVWFAVTMGTGAISLLFHSFPFGHDLRAMEIMTLIIFFLNLVLFIVFTVISVTRYILFPSVWRHMINHPVQSLYTGTFPMGFTTLLNISVTLINEKYGFGGEPFLLTMWTLWWADVVISVMLCWGMVHFMGTAQKHALENMTAAWLLPVVTIIVASSTGGVIAPALSRYNQSYALITEVTSVFMVSIGLSLALMLLTVYILRLIIHGLPQGASVLSVFLPLGPTGQAGYSILLAGQFFKATFPLNYGDSEFLTSSTTGDIIYVICVCTAFVLWALATMWMIFALLAVQHVLRRTRYPFKVYFWGLIFPNGVYANLTISLANVFDSPFLRYWGSIYAVATLILWTWVAFKTVILAYSRTIFEAPCLDDVGLNDVDCTCAREHKS